jgi:hypothetical protein
MLGEKRLVLCEVLVFGGGEEGGNSVDVESVEGVGVYL